MGELSKYRSKHGKSDTIWYWLQINVHLLIIIGKPKDSKLRLPFRYHTRYHHIYELNLANVTQWNQYHNRLSNPFHTIYVTWVYKKQHYNICLWCIQTCVSIELAFNASILFAPFSFHHRCCCHTKYKLKHNTIRCVYNIPYIKRWIFVTKTKTHKEEKSIPLPLLLLVVLLCTLQFNLQANPNGAGKESYEILSKSLSCTFSVSHAAPSWCCYRRRCLFSHLIWRK